MTTKRKLGKETFLSWDEAPWLKAAETRTWVSDDDRTWHWYFDGIVNNPSGPAKCGATPEERTWKGRLVTKRPHKDLICRACIEAKHAFNAQLLHALGEEV